MTRILLHLHHLSSFFQVCYIWILNDVENLAVDHAHKESAEDREALGLNGSNGLKKERSGSNHDKETFQGQINVSFCL